MPTGTSLIELLERREYYCQVSKEKLAPRVWINSSILLFGALLAHAVSCGTFISFIPFVIISITLIVVIAHLSSQEIEGPKLAFLIVLLQFSTHILLGGMSMNTNSMLLSHLTAGIVSYLFVIENERFWKAVRAFPKILRVVEILPSLHVKSDKSTSTFIHCFIQNFIIKIREDFFLIAAQSRIPAPPHGR